MLGKKLRKLRAQKKLTLEYVGAALDISTSQIQRFESGEREPRASEIMRLAALFGVNPLYLLSDGDAIENPPPIIMPGSSPPSAVQAYDTAVALIDQMGDGAPEFARTLADLAERLLQASNTPQKIDGDPNRSSE